MERVSARIDLCRGVLSEDLEAGFVLGSFKKQSHIRGISDDLLMEAPFHLELIDLTHEGLIDQILVAMDLPNFLL